MKFTTLLVGMHFRPPAKAILAHLAGGTRLYLRAEPENQYDSNAIQVLWDGADFPDLPEDSEARLQRQSDLLSQGFSEEEVMQAPEFWHLGYIAKTGGKPLQGKPWVGNAEVLRALTSPDGFMRDNECSLAFGPEGEPLVVVQVEE